MPRLRKRLLTEEWVLIAPERTGRPRRLGLVDAPAAEGDCPFCLSNPGHTPDPVAEFSSPDFPDSPWAIRALPNKFPALLPPGASLTSPDRSSPFEQPALGYHEVLVESPDHHVTWTELSEDHLTSVLRAWQCRVSDLQVRDEVASIQLFKNQGPRAGASLPHVHSQIAALPLIPARHLDEVRHFRAYREETGRCALCDLIADTESPRQVLAADHAAALTPFASRAPFETWIVPTSHDGSLADASLSTLRDTAALALEILRRWHALLGPVDYNLLLHTVPFAFIDEPYYHWHLEMLPRTGQIAGFELGSGMTINPVASETAAELLRESNHQRKASWISPS